MKRKSAVQWLIEQIQNGNITSEKTDCGYFVMIKDNCLEIARGIMKEQIMDAYLDGVYQALDNDEAYENWSISGEQYYNQSYFQNGNNL